MMNWPRVHLGDVAKIERDGVAPSVIPNGTLYVGLEHIEPGGRLLDVRQVFNGELASTKFRFSPRHLLYGKLRPYLAKIAMPGFEGVCSTDILPVLPGPNLDRSFLAHILRQPEMVALAASRSEGANLPRLSPKTLADFKIPLPSLDEQKRIAAILDQADHLRWLRQRALDRLNDLGRAIFFEMFYAAEQFDECPLRDLCEVITDGTHYTPTYVDEGIMFLSAKNVTSGYVDWASVKYIPPRLHKELQKRVAPQVNDILLAKNGTTGIAAIVDKDFTFDIYVSLALLRPSKEVLPTYLHHALNSQQCVSQFHAALKGIGVPNLHLKDIRQARIPKPPLALQDEFVQRIVKVEKVREQHRVSLESMNALFAALQHRAFNGEL